MPLSAEKRNFALSSISTVCISIKCKIANYGLWLIRDHCTLLETLDQTE